MLAFFEHTHSPIEGTTVVTFGPRPLGSLAGPASQAIIYHAQSLIIMNSIDTWLLFSAYSCARVYYYPVLIAYPQSPLLLIAVLALSLCLEIGEPFCPLR